MLNPRFRRNGKLDDKLHSNDHARINYGPRIGSTSFQPFSKRQSVEHNRKVVGRYRSSQVGSLPSHTSGPEDLSKSPKPPRTELPPRQSFSEPPGRKYNPYS